MLTSLSFSAPNATRRFAAALSLAAALLSFPSSGQSSPTPSSQDENEAGKIQLISATDGIGGRTTLDVGLEFELKPGWKIYWRMPGDAGYPPQASWTGSTNVTAPEIQWPVPGRFVEAGLQSVGYHDRIILPLAVAITDPAQSVHLQTKVDYLACAKLCVPMTANLVLDVPTGPATPPSIYAPLLAQARERLPQASGHADWTIDHAELVPDGATDLLRVTASGKTAFTHPDLFVEDGSNAPFAIPTVKLQDDGKRAVLGIAKLSASLRGKPLTLTLTEGERGIETTLTPALAPPPTAGAGLLSMIAVAFLGGLILNLMPCVLPILSLKVLAVIRMGGAEKAHARSAFLSSSAGILSSFLALAGLLIGLKAAGHTIGWGLHFQHPAFLAVMMVILVLFAANLWGLFHIPLPSFLGGLAMDAHGKPLGGHGPLGHFLSGLFATLLATPCSAPFLGTAIGFALGNGPKEILVIFTTMGLGLATPFLALAVMPHWATRLPKPGLWMVYVTRGMGLALAGTALWLGVLLSAEMFGQMGTAAAADSQIPWTPFDQAKIDAAVKSGKVVFVDVTADWCISCKVNKVAVIERGAVAARLQKPDVVDMVADWTLPNDDIAHYLESFGRYGIPFNAVYGPQAPQGIALSELPGSDEILSAIAKAK